MIMGMELLALNSSPLCNVTPRTRRRIHHTPNNYKVSVAMMMTTSASKVSVAMMMTSASKVSVAMMMTSASKVYDSVLENKKHVLLTSLQDTQRGLLTTPHQRSSIEQALVNVEGTNVGQPIDFNKLDGTWRLQYTSAPDVLVLFQAAATLPFFQVGQIFQKFECRHNSTGGIIRNVVRWSIPNFFEEQEGATLLVSAKFTLVSARNIYLQFQEITLQDINISEQLQALISPAILPRSFISLQILQYLRTFKAQILVRDSGRESVGGLYYLSYLDDNMLLGRAVGGGGVFVFTRAQSLY